MLQVPVISSIGIPLMPTRPARARRLLNSGWAYAFWSRGIFCIRLKDQANGDVQTIAVGIDPGSKKEAFTVKSKSHTYLNGQSDAVAWVKDRVETRRNMRRARRYRKTPCRANRKNRKRGCLPPSAKSCQQIKLNICKWLCRLYPSQVFVVEDVSATTKPGQKKWNLSFSPLETGKKWFYEELGRLGKTVLKQGYETCQMRKDLGLKKLSNKLSNDFYAHCVDSWVLANSYVGGHNKPDNEDILLITPIQLHRRQLHRFQPSKGNIRKPYGGTRSLNFKRGSLVRHKKYGLVYVGGAPSGKISLHSIQTGNRITTSANSDDILFVCFNPWRNRYIKGKIDI